MRNILIMTPYDRDTLINVLNKLTAHIKELPIEVQSPALFADYIYRNMEETNPYSFFTCLLASIDAYRNMSQTETVFMTNAPLRFMIGASSQEIIYDEIWLYSENVTTTHEAAMEYYESRTKGTLSEYLKLYKAEDATRKFTTFNGLVAAISKELGKELRGYGDV
jgi:hypothetical protein